VSHQNIPAGAKIAPQKSRMRLSFAQSPPKWEYFVLEAVYGYKGYFKESEWRIGEAHLNVGVIYGYDTPARGNRPMSDVGARRLL
jgi:hypothetical protein